MVEEIQTKRCNKCKVDLTVDKFKTNKAGELLKRCIDCNKKYAHYRCPHGRQCKSRCHECLGHPANRGKCSRCRKSFEPDEDGHQTCYDCRHKRNVNYICIHNKSRHSCKICYPCPHNKAKYSCVKCIGCEHGKFKERCQKCCPIGHLAHSIRGRVYTSLKRGQQIKTQSTLNYLGASIDTIKEHIASKFEEGMSWDNHGEWHIDHIVPIKYDDPTLEQQIERLHYTNLQPLWAAENVSKNNRYCG